jgi:hypothetical protein
VRASAVTATAAAAAAAAAPAAAVHVYHGSNVWAPGELEARVAAGDWGVGRATPADVLGPGGGAGAGAGAGGLWAGLVGERGRLAWAQQGG